MNLAALIAHVDAKVVAGSECALPTDVFAFSTDTRTLKKGDVYIALRGPNFDGSDYLAQAVEKGALVVITNQPCKSLSLSLIHI